MTNPLELIARVDAGVESAVRRARRESGVCIAVYVGATDVVVQDVAAVQPKDVNLHCIAQHWRDDEVQIRYARAGTEWRRISREEANA